MHRKLITSAALAFAASALPARAAVIDVSYALDPAVIGPSINQATLPTPFTAGVGDTVNIHLTFTTPTLTLSGDTALWLLSLASDNAILDISSQWTFLSPSANLVPFVTIPFEKAENVHLGSYLTANLYRLDSAPITFSGIDLSMIILAAEDYSDGTPSVDPRTYSTIALYPFDGVVGGGPAVPEPASWAMMLIGAGVVGGALRDRRRVRVTYV